MTQYSGKIIRKTPVVPTQQAASGVWTTADAAAAVKNNIWPVAGVPDPISRSLRFRASATAYLTRTYGTPTNNKVWTWSAWVKRGSLSLADANHLFMASPTDISGNPTTYSRLVFETDNTLRLQSNSSAGEAFTSSAAYRDPSAWYHIVLSMNAASTVVNCYVNGVEISYASKTDPSNTNTAINGSGNYHRMGLFRTAEPRCFDGYMAEVNFIDGQALTPSSFGTTDALTGAWIPMPYTGTYGANGWYLNFKDNTSTTTLGYDYSGNSNTWATTNFSLTAGITYDSMLDVPTPWVGYSATTDTTAVTRGNYAVLNPLSTSATLSSGNLDVASLNDDIYATVQVTSGKWYWEYTLNGTTNYNFFMGVYNSTGSTYAAMGMCNGGNSPNTFNVVTSTNGTVTSPTGSRPSQPATIGFKLDVDAGSIEFYINGTLNGSVTGITNWPSGDYWIPFLQNYTSTFSYQPIVANFGQRPFAQSVPSGHKALCTTNLPTPTIILGAQYFAASTYTGTGAAQSIVNSGNNTTATTFQPDFIWFKSRAQSFNNTLYDSVRGRSKALVSNTTDAEDGNATSTEDLTSFNSNGFSLGTVYFNSLNNTTSNPIAWQWKAGGAAVSNTAGTITSQVSANTTAGFSIVTYTGTGATSSSVTIGHGLGATPAFVITKARSTTSEWSCWHQSLGGNYGIWLNSQNARNGSQWGGYTNFSSTVFSPPDLTYGNVNGVTYVNYLFAEVAGYSKFGSYTGNGSTDGPFVYLGFRPRWVLFKVSTAGGYSWLLYDSSRDTYNVTDLNLRPNLSDAESSQSANYLDFLSNGFKIRGDSSGSINPSQTVIYASFAENPFKYSYAR